MKAAKPSLRNDQRGAVMVTGIFFASFLIGVLWYLMGVGEAIVFRDRMQEASDSAAFTSAAIHAKGMNFISACNLIMLVLVTIHIILGLIADIVTVICFFTLFGCTLVAPTRTIWTTYADIMKPTLTVVHYLEVGAAIGFPFLALGKGAEVGSKYKSGRIANVAVLTPSRSMLPGPIGTGAQMEIGLPVESQSFQYLCRKLANAVFDFLKKVLDDIPIPGLGAFIDQVKGVVGTALELRYCDALGAGLADANARDAKANTKIKEQNDAATGKTTPPPGGKGGAGTTEKVPTTKEPKPPVAKTPTKTPGKGGLGWTPTFDPGIDPGWANDGPMVLVDGAQNGASVMQVWGLNIAPSYGEVSENKVRIASRDFGGGGAKSQMAIGYIAQAEYYFDCDADWGTKQCNGSGGETPDFNASFALNWRARLIRVQVEELAGFLAGSAFDAGVDAAANKAAKKAQGTNNKTPAAPGDAANAPTTGEIADKLKDALDPITGPVRDEIVDAAKGAASGLGMLH